MFRKQGTAGYKGGILVTENSGKSWKPVSADIGEAAMTHILLACYLDSFRKTPLTFQPLNGDAPDPGMLVEGTAIAAYWPDGRNNGTGPQVRNLGYRLDCLGDMTTDLWKKEGWSHMKDIYPKDIIKSGMAEAWKKAPVTMEICYTFLHWLQKLKYDEKTVAYIFGEALKWHITSFNAKSSAVPKVWSPLVDKWLNKMGYRFVLRKFEYPSFVTRQGQLAFTSLWENIGVAPIYKDYKFAIRLKNSAKVQIFSTGSDLLTWLPGDIVYDETLHVPLNVPVGKYQLEIAIVSPVSYEARVKLAINGMQKDGWYTMGDIEVRDK